MQSSPRQIEDRRQSSGGYLPRAEDREWTEGSKKRVWHLKAERKSGLSKAKREQFKRQNEGRLFCERCGFDPVKEYDTELAESVAGKREKPRQ